MHAINLELQAMPLDLDRLVEGFPEQPPRAAENSSAAPLLDMTGQSIICFAKDWSEDPTSNNHVMRQLARHNKVLWLNSISTRTPSLSSGRDLKKIGHKLVSFFRGAEQVQENLWIYTPLVLPLPHSAWAASINRLVLRLSLSFMRRRLGMKRFQLWSFLPTVTQYVGKLGESLAIYYCTDEYSQFSYVDRARVQAAEKDLCERVDLVFASAQSLVDRRREWNPRTYLASHGVDHRHFASARDEATPVAPDIAALPGPVLGFFGLIHEWIDVDLIEFIAKRHPEWSIALVGRVSVDVSRLKARPNVHFLGRKPYEQLPQYCKGFTVGLIPFVLNDLTLKVNPIKLREYLSAGLPVVSTALPEVERYRGICTVAQDYEQFEQGILRAIVEDSPEVRQSRSDAMRSETWESKVAAIGRRVMQVQLEKRRSR